MVHNVINLVSLNPEYIPVVSFNLLVASLSKSLQNTIAERGFELYLREVSCVVILFNVLSKVFRHLYSKLIINSYN